MPSHYDRRKSKPTKDAKTIPQKIARKELIAGGGKAKLREQLKAGEPLLLGGGGAMPSTKSAGVLARNVRGVAPTRRGDAKVKVDARTRQGKRQKRGKLDLKNKEDLAFLRRNERDRMRMEKGGGLKVGQEVSGMFYGKKRTGKIKEIEVKKGINRSVLIVDNETGKEMRINTKTLL